MPGVSGVLGVLPAISPVSFMPVCHHQEGLETYLGEHAQGLSPAKVLHAIVNELSHFACYTSAELRITDRQALPVSSASVSNIGTRPNRIGTPR